MARDRIRVADLAVGDVCSGSGGEILRVVRQGVFRRSPGDERTDQPWPEHTVEVLVQYPGGGRKVAYWNVRTTLGVERPGA